MRKGTLLAHYIKVGAFIIHMVKQTKTHQRTDHQFVKLHTLVRYTQCITLNRLCSFV